MFSTDYKTEKEKKAEEEADELREMLREYKKNKTKVQTNNMGDGSFGNFYKNSIASGSNTGRFLTSMIPVFAVIGTGCALWFFGFAVRELAKIAPFTNGISIASPMVNMITTSSFWKFALCVFSLCMIVFAIWSAAAFMFKKLTNSVGCEKCGSKKLRQCSRSMGLAHSAKLGNHGCVKNFDVLRKRSCKDITNKHDVVSLTKKNNVTSSEVRGNFLRHNRKSKTDNICLYEYCRKHNKMYYQS